MSSCHAPAFLIDAGHVKDLARARDALHPAAGESGFRLSNTEIYSLTWNFASPDGRATFHLDKMDDGEAVLVWRRIGDRTIYESP